MEPDEKPCELVNEWGLNDKEKKKDGSEPKILFKKKIFLRDDDNEMKDTVAKHYIYIQALYSVIESEYPCKNTQFFKFIFTVNIHILIHSSLIFSYPTYPVIMHITSIVYQSFPNLSIFKKRQKRSNLKNIIRYLKNS